MVDIVRQGRLIERSKGKGTKLCVAVRIEQKQTCMHYQPTKQRQFLKIVLATPTMVTQARGKFYHMHPFSPIAHLTGQEFC